MTVTALDLRLSQPTIENTLRDAILFALGRRIASVGSVAALRAVPTQSVGQPMFDDDKLASVASSPVVSYRWSNVSIVADNGSSVIQPHDVPPGGNGRWIQWSSPIYFSTSVGGNSTTLDQITSGPLERVILIDKHYTEDELIALIEGDVPAVIIEPKGDDPDEATEAAGSSYVTPYHFEIHVVCQNLRDRREALQGSVVPSESTIPGAHAIEGLVRALLEGANLNPAVNAIMEVRPRRGLVWGSDFVQRRSIKSRLYDVIVSEELANAPNETGPVEDLRFQAHLSSMPVVPPAQTTVDEPPATFDSNNYLISGILVAYPMSGLTQSVTAGSAVINGGATPVTYAGGSETFAAWSDTYRDLNPDGTLTLVAVPNDAPEPPVTASALRIGVTRTNASGIVADAILAGTYELYGPQVDLGAV